MTSKPRLVAAALLACGSLFSLVACSDEAPPADIPPGSDAAADVAPDRGEMAPDAAAPDAAPDMVAPADGNVVDAPLDRPASPDMAQPMVDAARDSAGDAPGSPDGARDGVSTEASVDVTPDVPKALDAAPDGYRTCIFQSSNGPIECHAASPDGKTYCDDNNVCQVCQVAEWLNCDGNDVNGCELFVNTDNCGACGRKCTPQQACVFMAGTYMCRLNLDGG